MGPFYILRLDDISPFMNWDRFEAVATTAEQYSIKPVLGVIPEIKDPELIRGANARADFWARMRLYEDRGWEIAMHGHDHVSVSRGAGLLGRGTKSEFCGLPKADQRKKLMRGLAVMHANGLKPTTFMAPSHSFDLLTIEILRELGFTHITDGFGIYPYNAHGMTFVPQLFARPRRMPFGVYTFCAHLTTEPGSHLKRLTAFMERERSQFISFKDVVGLRVNPAISLGLRLVTRCLFQSYWRLQRSATSESVSPELRLKAPRL